MQPLALDLFCGAGGVCIGLQRAGFRVVGVDIVDQPDYPGDFVLGDALRPPVNLAAFDFVWASPPCLHASVARRGGPPVPDLIPATRSLLAPHPVTCIENVPPAAIRPDLVFTGPMFGLDRIYRRRHFELSFPVLCPPIQTWRKRYPPLPISTHLSYGASGWKRCRERGVLTKSCITVQEALEAMGIPIKMTARGVGNAIPPAYAEWIGRAAMRELGYPP